MGLMANAPDKRYPFLVITGPQAHNCDKNGIPASDEIETLERVLDATGDFLTGLTAKVLAGTYTHNCQRVNYYYVKDTTGIRNAIYRLYNRTYKDYKFVINIKQDPYWRNYLTFLYPSEETQNWMENNKVVTTMLQSGDSLTKQRNITFAACFKSDTARTAFSDFATGKGYTIQKSPTVKSGTHALCLLFSKYNYVQMDTLNKYTFEIKKEITKHDGAYDGWSAPLK